MARTGLTKAEVKASRERLLAEGRYPSVDAVRHDLGTGSKSTIHKHLKELQEDNSQAGGIRRDDTERSLNALVEQLAGRLHDDADRRFRELCASHEQALQAKERELAELRDTVERLSARIDELETHGELQHEGGFGDFSNLFASSRGGQRDDTAFNIILSGGRSATIDFDSPQIQLTPRLM
ncbi:MULTISPECIES: DNA-binding protein [unclassified Duganella]|uniref:DNA-binding protein n=1 Tax=unclassified Duganella TaxID=2636909 RepID=UPI000882BC88|nr:MULTISPECIES: DNA-binding protein [unclassified Duganella]SDG81654.1 replication region DNA-binding N-term [Duganella sp. OV458]SDK09073.1 replication region DNA-binding N-term [Duganella sp. OV510]